MTQSKKLLISGSIVASAALIGLAYNFAGLYTIVGKCADVVDSHSCTAKLMDDWHIFNAITLIGLGVGVALITVGLVGRSNHKAK